MTIEQLLTDLIIALKQNTSELRTSNLRGTELGETLRAASGHPNGVVTAAEVAAERDATNAPMAEAKKSAQAKKDKEITLSFDDVRDAIRKLAAADRPAAEALLAKFDVSKISQLEGKPEVWQEAYAEATK